MLKVGMIGCGSISKKHLDTLSRLDRVELVAVSDVQKTRMEEASVYYQKNKGYNGLVKHYGNYLDLIQDSEIDIVLILVISGLHATITKQSLIEGKHVIVEKPLALSLKEADEIIALSKFKKRKVLVCHQLRYRPVISKIKQVLEEGYLGEPYMGIVSARINRSPEYYASASWRGRWEQDGGMLINQGIHIVDLLIWLLGDIETVYGEIAVRMNIPQKETEDIATSIINFTNKAKGIIEVNSITKPKNQGYYLSLFCEKGSITLSGTDFDKLDHCFIENQDKIVQDLKILCVKKDEHFNMYQNFIDSIVNDTVLIMDAAEGKRALETIFAIYKSNNIKARVKLPLLNFSTKEMVQFPANKENLND